MSPSPSSHRSARLGALFAAVLLVLVACSGGDRLDRPERLPGRRRSPTAAPTATPAPTPSPTPAPAFPATLTDDEGTAVTLKAEPQKIVSLTPAAPRSCSPSEQVRASSPRPTSTTTRPRPSPCPTWPASPRSTSRRSSALEADLVIAGGNFFNPPDAIAKLREVGVPVLVVYAPTPRACSRTSNSSARPSACRMRRPT